jgi:uncharacterized damage-inducible protein DinB
MLAHWRMMANYNAWANRRLYDACAALSEADRRAGLGAFFGSLHGTLSHLLVADRIWMGRFTGETPPDLTLDAEPYAKFADLRAAREAEDARIAAFVGGLDDATLASPILYTTISKPAPVRQPLGTALAHVFNHQTHHRGQCHAMLTRVAQAAPPLDLLYYQRDSGEGMA